jgi:GLPGLI family protein
MYCFAGKDCYERRVEGDELVFFEMRRPDNKIGSFAQWQQQLITLLLREGGQIIKLLKIITIMKWFILLSAGLMVSAVDAAAQRSDTAQVLLHYKFTHVRDTNNRSTPYSENMVLVIGKRAGVYRSYDRQLGEARDKKKWQEAVANSPNGLVRFDKRVSGSGTEYYQFPNDKKLFTKEELFGNFLLTDALPVIDWQITGDTANFGGLHCQKAEGHFKGRDYTAWFCPDLPLHVGPWKLNGLPGVIVEAADATGDIRFTFDGVEKAILAKNDGQPATQGQGEHRSPPPLPGMEEDNSDPAIIKIPDHATRTTDREFAKLQEAFRKDPNAFAQSMMAMRGGGGPAGGSGMKVDFKPGSGTGPVINNPIELPEKP